MGNPWENHTKATDRTLWQDHDLATLRIEHAWLDCSRLIDELVALLGYCLQYLDNKYKMFSRQIGVYPRMVFPMGRFWNPTGFLTDVVWWVHERGLPTGRYDVYLRCRVSCRLSLKQGMYGVNPTGNLTWAHVWLGFTTHAAPIWIDVLVREVQGSYGRWNIYQHWPKNRPVL